MTLSKSNPSAPSLPGVSERGGVGGSAPSRSGAPTTDASFFTALGRVTLPGIEAVVRRALDCEIVVNGDAQIARAIHPCVCSHLRVSHTPTCRWCGDAFVLKGAR